MLDTGVIEGSRSVWSFIVVLIENKGRTKRFGSDFRALIKLTKSNAYSLQVIDDILKHN